jgi:[ribosomal protein S18]-alanine N-acetyltransferase
MNESDVAAVVGLDGPSLLRDQELYAELRKPWSHLWVVREEGPGVVAFAMAWHVADELHVLNLATRSDRRRRGIGRALMNRLVEFARAERVRHVFLEVRRSNRPALNLYRSLGFFAMGIRKKYYPDDEDAVEMVLVFDPTTGHVLPKPDEVRLEG